MMIIEIPGYKSLEIKHIVCDYNGTIAIDGKLINGVRKIINDLSEKVDVHIITADTFGFVERELENVHCKLVKISSQNQAVSKLEYVLKLGKDKTICIGNGNNDRLMVKEAELGIALLQEEGTCIETLLVSDIVCKNIIDAFGYLMEPKRLIATLRN
jgi:soluble P-type ATPase